ncbi:MAG: CZB domain-containing protein [Firmicutes bacterium]|nr:CZB domain-containing protein [Bacillota bacterium]
MGTKNKLYLVIAALVGLLFAIVASLNNTNTEMADAGKMAARYSDFKTQIEAYQNEHTGWVNALSNHMLLGTKFNKPLDPHKCNFGRWYYSYLESEDFKFQNSERQVLLELLGERHRRLHESGAEVVSELQKGNKKNASKLFQNNILPTLTELNDINIKLINLSKTQSYKYEALVKKSMENQRMMGLAAMVILILIGIILAAVVIVENANAFRGVKSSLQDFSLDIEDKKDSVDDEIDNIAQVFNMDRDVIKRTVNAAFQSTAQPEQKPSLLGKTTTSVMGSPLNVVSEGPHGTEYYPTAREGSPSVQVQDVDSGMQVSQYLKTLANNILMVLKENMGAISGDIRIVDSRRNILTTIASFGHSNDFTRRLQAVPLDKADYLTVEAIRRRVPLTHNEDKMTIERIATLRACGMEDCRYVVVPIDYMDEIVGTLLLIFDGKRDFMRSEIDLLRTINETMGLGQAIKRTISS